MGEKYHARLRPECISLGSLHYWKNLVDSPSCLCESVETTKRYLIECPNYHKIRNQTLLEFLHFPIKTSLCGDASFSRDQNENMLESVQIFIILSDRFNALRISSSTIIPLAVYSVIHRDSLSTHC